MNNVSITGNISSDIDLRATPNGKYVASFHVAVTNPFNREKTSFVPVEAWGKTAENTSSFCTKGSKVGITGHIEVDQWEKDGQKRYKTKVVANMVEFLTPKKTEDKPQKHTHDPGDPFQNNGQIDISESEMPF